ncbi:N(5)-(carboxyethyl)ornithine synthase [Bacillus testis]|uniref:N(5)-(carboxyethyl)ornithine synthase n=1 Tax=Bacillus testis TaxID=1622072 RepID=UPI00067ECD4B|nr:N(5)-(carboxyethyl)ornithine synthase [Bacillus testis]
MLRTIGFPIGRKEHEKRRALTIEAIKACPYKEQLVFEKDYGTVLGISNKELANTGVHIANREEVLRQDIICDPKAGDAEYIESLTSGQILFGWIHAVQNRELTEQLVKNGITAIAWEDMNERGRHLFWRNNEIAGEAAVLHALEQLGILPYEVKAAILGRGNTARGAYKILTKLGADVTVYDRRTEELFRQEIDQYDVLVNAILWDINRNDHIIYKEDLQRMKKGSLIIDVSCDEGKGVETSKPTTIEQPIYSINGIYHYVVDHTPSIYHASASKSISEVVSKYLPILLTKKEQENAVLQEATIIKDQTILDKKILDYQRKPSLLA